MSSWGLELGLESDVGVGGLYGAVSEDDSESEGRGAAHVVGCGRIAVLLAVVLKLLFD